MRLAYLMLLHFNSHQLEKPIKRLLHKEAAFYIHIDKNAAIAYFKTGKNFWVYL